MAKDKFADIESPEQLDNADAVAEANAPAAASPKSASDMVEVTITKLGAGKVSTGVHVAGEGDIFAERGDKLNVTADTAASLERRGFGETD